MESSKPRNIVFMKIGDHADEKLESIISRKRREESDTGILYWGYSGNLIDPLKQVRPFALEAHQTGEPVIVMMSRTSSKTRAGSPQLCPTQFSSDGDQWCPLPEGIAVTGSKYALVCHNLRSVDYQIDLLDYVVAKGRKEGQALAKFVRDHFDKACARLSTRASRVSGKLLRIEYVADLVAPYAVLVR